MEESLITPLTSETSEVVVATAPAVPKQTVDTSHNANVSGETLMKDLNVARLGLVHNTSPKSVKDAVPEDHYALNGELDLGLDVEIIVMGYDQWYQQWLDYADERTPKRWTKQEDYIADGFSMDKDAENRAIQVMDAHCLVEVPADYGKWKYGDKYYVNCRLRLKSRAWGAARQLITMVNDYPFRPLHKNKWTISHESDLKGKNEYIYATMRGAGTIEDEDFINAIAEKYAITMPS